MKKVKILLIGLALAMCSNFTFAMESDVLKKEENSKIENDNLKKEENLKEEKEEKITKEKNEEKKKI